MSVKPKDCACIVLASGLSERFGTENKLLAELSGKPIIAHVLDMIDDVGFGDVFVVSSNCHKLTSIIKSYGASLVKNPTPEKGQGASLAFGAEAALAEGYQTACIKLADMPLVKFNHINNLLEKYEPNSPLFSRCGNVLMPPAIFNHQALRQATNLDNDLGGKSRVKGNLETALPLSDFAARDMDTREDLEQIQEALKLS